MKSYVSRDVSTMLPAELYQADGKTFNAEVAHPLHGRPFRPEITTIIDAKTRKVVGWSAALDESANAVADAAVEGLVYRRLKPQQYAAKADIAIKMEAANG